MAGTGAAGGREAESLSDRVIGSAGHLKELARPDVRAPNASTARRSSAIIVSDVRRNRDRGRKPTPHRRSLSLERAFSASGAGDTPGSVRDGKVAGPFRRPAAPPDEHLRRRAWERGRPARISRRSPAPPGQAPTSGTERYSSRRSLTGQASTAATAGRQPLTGQASTAAPGGGNRAVAL